MLGTARLTKVRELTIYRNDHYYCGPAPSAVQLADGSIMVAFRRYYNWVRYGVWRHGYPAVEACLTTSGDGGETWTEPRIFNGGFLGNQNLTMLADGTIVYITKRWECVPVEIYERLKDTRPVQFDSVLGGAYGQHGVQVMRSFDQGRSWDGPFFVSPVPETEPVLPDWASPSHLRASARELSDGTLGLSVYSTSAHSQDDRSVWFMTSADKGQTWSARGRIAHDPRGEFHYNEADVYECPSGKLVAFIRVEKDPEKSIYTASSTDGGGTWSKPRREGVKGYPCQAAQMPSGRVLLAYGYRYEPMGVRARLLDPECEDIAGAEELVLRDDGGMRDLGYPHVLPLADGTALVTYYFNVDGGTRFVAGSIVAEA